MNFTTQLTAMAIDIHAKNVLSGWWTDIKSGESTLLVRSRPEVLELINTEVTEADEGHSDNLMDDKLPHLLMFDVEIADVAIRLFDIIGAEISIHGELDFDYDEAIDHVYHELHDKSHERQLLSIVNRTSKAMEHLRKSRTTEYRIELAWALATTFGIATIRKLDLFDVISQKASFNATREDHKLSNRLQQGGKKF
jgi:hypothetical protein